MKMSAGEEGTDGLALALQGLMVFGRVSML